MSNVYIIKDPVYNESTSRIHNFTLEWIKWYRFAKIAPREHKIESSDIVIVNLYDGVDPCAGYDIHPTAKRIYIVHKINRDNVKHLEDANFIIYINDVMQQIAELAGIRKPCIACPRYPLYEFFGTEFLKEDFVHIGGWFFDDRIEGLTDALLNMNSKLPKDIQYHYYYVWGGVESRKKKIHDQFETLRKIPVLNNRVHTFVESELSYNISLFTTRIAKYGFIHRNAPTIEEVFDLINSKDQSILNYSISESSMLSMYQSSNVDVITTDNIECIPLYRDTNHFTFRDFAEIINNAVKKFS